MLGSWVGEEGVGGGEGRPEVIDNGRLRIISARSRQEKQDGCHPRQESLKRHTAYNMTQSAYLDDHDSVTGERACHADVDTGLTAVSRCAEVNRKIDTPQTVTR